MIQCNESPYIFLASSKNCASPISVNGCLSNPRIELNGHVQICAPASAARTICSGFLIEAASISVSNPCTMKICDNYQPLPCSCRFPCSSKWRCRPAPGPSLSAPSFPSLPVRRTLRARARSAFDARLQRGGYMVYPALSP